MKRVLSLYFPYLTTDRLSVHSGATGGSAPDPAPAQVPGLAPEAPAAVAPAQVPGLGQAPGLAPGLVSGVAPAAPAAVAPVVVTATQASVVRVVAADARAVRAGIRVGMTLAEARASLPSVPSVSSVSSRASVPSVRSVPSLVARPHDPAADRAALESLAVWADRFSPYVHLEGDDTLLLDVSGCHRLFPDEETLLRRVVDGVGELGYAARGALADTPGAAWALAHAHPADQIVAAPGRTAAALAPLPVGALRVEPGILAALGALGVETIEALLHLPRASLGARFGDDLLYRLDQALGDEPEVLTPFRPTAVLRSGLRIGRPTDRHDVLCEAVERTLACFCEQLERRVAGVRQLFVTFHCPELRPITLELNVSRATRSVRHLRSLLTGGLDNLQLPTGAAGVTLWARRVEPLDGWQDELFETGRADGEDLAELIDRLSNRLGPSAVVRPLPVSDHQPERAFEYVPLIGRGTRGAKVGTRSVELEGRSAGIGAQGSEREARNAELGTRSAGRGTRGAGVLLPASHFSLRPLRLLPRPVEVSVIAVVPEGPPSCFDWKGSREVIVDCAGPERLETGWWRGRHVRRDYFRAACRSGRGCWLFRQRETGQWFVHGWFD